MYRQRSRGGRVGAPPVCGRKAVALRVGSLLACHLKRHRRAKRAGAGNPPDVFVAALGASNGALEQRVRRFLLAEPPPADELIKACAQGELALVRSLVAAGADVDARQGDYGDRPLHAACGQGRLEVVRFLLEEAGADPHTSGDYDHNALHSSCRSGHVELTEYLIERAGVNMNKRRLFSSLTPMILACFKGHDKVVACLLRHGVQLELKGQYGTALHVASNSDKGTTQQCSSYSSERSAGQRAILRLLIEGGADKECRVRKYCHGPLRSHVGGVTPLHIAAVGSDKAAVELLLELGCPRTAKTDDGRQAWELAQAMEAPPDWVELLRPPPEVAECAPMSGD